MRLSQNGTSTPPTLHALATLESTREALDVWLVSWDNKHTMNKPTAPISDLLLRTIRAAVESGRTNYLALERETGLTRASIMRFVAGKQSLRLDMADRLAAYFGLALRERGKKGKLP